MAQPSSERWLEQPSRIGSRGRGPYPGSMLKPLLTLALMAAPVAAQAQQASDNAELRKLADQFDAAQTGGDRAALDRILAPDFLFVRASGRVGDREEFMAGFADPGTRLSAYEIGDRLFLRVSPDVVIVGGEARAKSRDGGKPITQHFRFSDTFARRGSQWLVVYVQITGLGTP